MSALSATLIVLLSLLATTLVGFSLARFFTGDLSRAERLGWSLACGFAAQALLYLTLLAFRASPGPRKLLAAEVFLVIASFLFRGRQTRSSTSGASRRHSAGVAFFLAVAVAGAALFFLEALAEPMWTTDYLAIWGLKAKTIFFTGAIPSRLFHDSTLYWSHPEYPLLLPLTFASLASSVGDWNDQAMALFYPACEAATLLVLFGFLARCASVVAAAVAVALAALCFPLYAPVNVGTAEIPLALGFVLLCCALLDVLERDTAQVRMRLAVAALFCAAMKQEGTLFIVLLLVSLLAWRLSAAGRTSPTVWLCLALAPVFHALTLRLLRGSLSNRDFDWTLLEPGRWLELLSRGARVFGHIATVQVPQAAIPLAALLLFFFLTRSSFADRLLLPLLAQAFFYAAICSFSAFDPIWAVESSFARITIALFPALTLILGPRLTGTGYGAHDAGG